MHSYSSHLFLCTLDSIHALVMCSYTNTIIHSTNNLLPGNEIVLTFVDQPSGTRQQISTLMSDTDVNDCCTHWILVTLYCTLVMRSTFTNSNKIIICMNNYRTVDLATLFYIHVDCFILTQNTWYSNNNILCAAGYRSTKLFLISYKLLCTFTCHIFPFLHAIVNSNDYFLSKACNEYEYSTRFDSCYTSDPFS